MLRIEITLPRETKRRALLAGEAYDRARYGEFVILVENDRILGPVACLGKGGGRKTAQSWDWQKRNHDTPTGRYLGAVRGPWSPESSYGPNPVIALEPIDGDALTAKRLGRSGLAIHGGGGQNVMFSTFGCVRVFDRTMAEIVRLLHRHGRLTDIPITISENL